ncbi:MAG: hypothetical protein IH969_02850, partial [Candidatus Krumholzibacteriota bacterium]|nr:hypothetical protein [Candidatus Krumholzibacteriota bacterium]
MSVLSLPGRVKAGGKTHRLPREGTMYIIWLAFFFSGIAGISYELVWAKYLVHLFGASTPAVSGTISIFFGGLALGAALFGRIFDRVSSPIRAYGILEIAIGCSAALVPWMVHTSESLLISWGSTGEMWPVRLLLSAGVLLVPATLIGATFPAMAAAARSMRDPTRRTALFYGVNTLGAVSGCVLTGFWTIPALGLQSTTWSMTFLNLAVGAMMLAISRAEVSHDGAAPVPATAAVPLAAPAPAVQRLSWRLVAVLSVTSGLLSIGTEVLWVRSLVLSFQGTVYVFAVVLTSYLIGIGAGSLLLASLRRFVRNEVSLLRYLYLGIGLSCVLAMILFPNFGHWSEAMRNAGVVKSWGTHIFTLSGLALLAMLPATLAMGASLPLLIGLADIPRREGRTAGTLYALNTFGGIAGSIGASFVLMPRLGLSGALMLHALGYLVLFAVIGIVRTQNTSKRIIAAAPALAAAVLFIVGIYPEVNGGRYIAGSRLLFYHDAPSGTVAIYEDRQRIRTLRVNNYYGLSDTSPVTVRLQRRLGHIAMLLHPAPDRALLIGLATGTTLSAMGEYRLRALDCVELHPTIIDVASHFTSANRKIWQRADVHIQKGDGRRFLRREGETYDVIVAPTKDRAYTIFAETMDR